MTTFFWCLEYCKVLFAYAFIMFIWPEIVFRRILKGRSLTFHFGFCTTVQIVLVNTVVLLLGLFHVLNTAVFCALFYGTAILCLIHRIPGKRKVLKTVQKLLTGTYGLKRFLADRARALRHRLRCLCDDCMSVLRGHIFEYGLLAAVVLFGVLYFSYGAFQDYSYGCGDLYPHNEWTYALTNGQIFSAGVYPEGMHCFIYAMRTLFGIRIYSCLLFTAGIHSAVFLLSIYILLKEIFCWRYSGILALMLFLTVDVKDAMQVVCLSRLQWTIPQEFGMPAMFLCVAFLLRYLKRKPEEPETSLSKKQKFLNMLRQEDLFVFTMALATTIVVHFYATIMAFFLCIAFVPVLLGRILRPKNFGALAASVILGCLIAVIPMAGALASGIPFQGSIGWAVNAMSGSDEYKSNSAVTGNTGTGSTGSGNTKAPTSGLEGGQNQGVGTSEATNEPVLVRVKDRLLQKVQIIYEESYVSIYGDFRTRLLIGCTVAALALFLLCRGIMMLLKYGWKKEVKANRYDHYFSLAFCTVIFMTMYSANLVGLPYLVVGARLGSMIQLLMVAMCCIPLDALCSVVILFVKENIMKVVGAIAVAAVYVLAQMTGTFRGYLHYELTRYNGAVMATYRITRELPPFSYTIVSTVDELYQMIEYGYHEELVQFINECVKENYTLPSRYVFLYVEKKPLKRSQFHFFSGPSWLASEKYQSFYGTLASVGDDVIHTEIDSKLGSAPYFTFPVWTQSYMNLEHRTIIESRVDMWCREFDRLYPGELHTYYEDDDFVCYYFEQNPACLYQLGFDLNRAE